MSDAPRVSGPSVAPMWADAGSFEPDPGERLEALATTGRGPLRVAARLAVAVEARLGGWPRHHGAQPGNVGAGDAGSRGVAAGGAVPAPAPEPEVPPERQTAPERRPGPPATVAHRRPDAPRSRSAALLAETLPAETGARPGPAGGGPRPAGVGQRPAGGGPRGAGPVATGTSSERTAGRGRPPRRSRPLQAERHRGAGALADDTTAASPFPADLAALADRRGPGVGDDDAWDRWLSSADTDHLDRADAALDRDPTRAERAEANLQRAASRLRTGRRRMAASLHPPAPGPAGTGR